MPYFSATIARFSFLLLACITAPALHATTYYVATTGSDTHTGSQASPFRTIAKAATAVHAGDTVLVSGGAYSERNIIPAASGTAGAMIVFKPNPGAGTVVLSHPATSSDDMTPVFELTNRNYIRIEGFQFKDFAYGRASIFISNGLGNVVMNNWFENLGNNEIVDGSATAVVYLKGKANVIRNNYFKNIFGDGVSLKANSFNNLISENTFIDFKGKPRGWSPTGSFSNNMGTEETSYGNNVFAFNYSENPKIMLWFDRNGSSSVVLRNVCSGGQVLFFNESRCARNIAQENIAYNTTAPAFQTARYETGFTADGRWINNVAYNCHTGYYIDKSDRSELRNNITYNNSTRNVVFTDTAYNHGPHVFRNNLWYTSGVANSTQYRGTATTVPAFQANVGETGGLSADPLFTNLTTGAEDFTLQAGSPAKGAGDDGRDMGAYPVYGKSAVGYNAALPAGNLEVNFDSAISAAVRGQNVQLTIQLSRAATSTVTLTVNAVAGDARSGDDFSLNQNVTFLPGETSKTISVSVVGGFNYDRLVAFRLENAVNATIGYNNLRILKIAKNANAGPDQTLIYSGANVNATLDGSGSTGTITSYVWSEGGTPIATGVNPTVSLGLGTHRITLTITSNGSTYTDEVYIYVTANSNVWLEAECMNVGTLWNIMPTDNLASGGKYVTIEKGNNSNTAAPTDTSGLLYYTFNISQAGAYTLWARALCPDANGDSYYLKMDNGSFSSWNGITNAANWVWAQYGTTYTLAAGTHTLTIGYREDDARLDKLLLTSNGTVPTDVGEDANNCTPIVQKVAAKVEAEWGTLGTDWSKATTAGVTYITTATGQSGTTPTSATKVATYTVTFPQAGTYNLYAKFLVAGGASNDSYYYGKGFGTKNPATVGDWVSTNGLAGNGYTAGTDVVGGSRGSTANNVWKWINMSNLNISGSGSQAGITFTVPAGALTQTFQVASREAGFQIDKFVFGIATSDFTVSELESFTYINNAPVVAPAQVLSVNENAAAATTVGPLSATDPNAVNALQGWKIVGGTGATAFAMDATTGTVKVANGAALNFETTPTYTLLVKVNDGTTPSVVETVEVNLTNLNDVVPVVTLQQQFSVGENASAGQVAGTVAATDGDDANQPGFTTFGNWELTDASNNFIIEAATGILKVAPGATIGSGNVSSYTVQVRVSDGLFTSTWQNVTVTVDRILPIVLKKFEARRQGSQVNLVWETTAEQNNQRFELLKSADGTRFQPLVTIAAKNTAATYTHPDKTPFAGGNYYRLLQYDKDGKVSNLGTRLVRFGAALQVSVYPNPVADFLNVSLPTGTIAAITLTDMAGKTVRSIAPNGTGTYRVATGNLAKGSYLLKVITTGGEAQVATIVKQ